MQTGILTHINRRNGMFIIRSADGEHSAWSLCSSFDLAIGDRIRGDLDALGSETLLHLARGQQFDAVGESGPSSLVAAIGIASPN